MKDFSYLERTLTTRKTIFLMCLSFGLVVAVLLGTIGFNSITEVERQYMTDQQIILLQIAFTVGLIMSLIGIVVLIHLLGGVKSNEILDYWDWIKRESKKK